MYNVSVRLSYAMRCIGRGQKAVHTFSAVMDLPPPPEFECYSSILLDSLVALSNMSMRNAVQGSKDVPAAFDGSWWKRGHSSLMGLLLLYPLKLERLLMKSI